MPANVLRDRISNGVLFLPCARDTIVIQPEHSVLLVARWALVSQLFPVKDISGGADGRTGTGLPCTTYGEYLAAGL